MWDLDSIRKNVTQKCAGVLRKRCFKNTSEILKSNYLDREVFDFFD